MACSNLVATERVTPNDQTSAMRGDIVWEPAKTVWLFAMTVGGVVALWSYASWTGAAVFIVLTAVTICAGHSVGMHRLLIHRSFTSPEWVMNVLVYLGVLVGMAGPFGMIRAHDMRDWHQRQSECAPHPSHGAGFWKDAVWQLCCSFRLDHPPKFEIEEDYINNRFFRFLEATWMLQQLPLAIVLYAFGGMGLVLWGVCLRVSVSLIGHWAVGHYAHKRGHQGWAVEGLDVQGYNLPHLGLVTFGESWHGNHHAFPHSAKLGVEKGQTDLGYTLIRALEFVGLTSAISTPPSQPAREGLIRTDPYKFKPETQFSSEKHANDVEKQFA